MTTKISTKELEAMYPGFQVYEGMFVRDGVTLFRVNTDQTSHNLTQWHFDDKTGDFYRLRKQLPDGSALIKRIDYNSRAASYYGGETFAKYLSTTFAIICFAIGAWIANSFSVGLAWVFFIFGALMLAPLLDTKSRRVGPEPLRRKAEEFGPKAPASPVNHPASDDLSYKPTV